MGRSLDDYRRKRDFDRTREPPPRGRRRRRGEPVFVVHRHAASRLHYDLRLEMEGVLKSWAVPKGFSYDPADKRLAVRTEDHPLEYEDFDGIIPAGEYGAGSMTIWDRGHYELVVEPDGARALEKGELKLVLRGRKLRGEWHMVRTRKEEKHWLLFKSRDRYAGKPRDTALGVDLSMATEAALPRSVRRMQPDGEVEPFTDARWIFEMEFEGRRVLAEKRGDEVRFRGVKARLEALERALAELSAENALIDGVLVVQDESGRPSRALLDDRLAGRRDDEVGFYAFDLLYYDDFDLRPMPLLDRKSALRAVLPEETTLLYVDHVPGDGPALSRAVADAGLPGAIAKLADGAYAAGSSDAWKRIPATRHTDAPGDLSALTSRPARSRRRSRVRITNVAKVFWPAEGYTKGELIAWYEQIADTLLPYLRDRAVHMNRFPDGIEGKSFYQRHANEQTPDWIPTVELDSESKGEPQRYMVCNERDTLLYIANAGSIDLHPWLSRIDDVHAPDWAVVDLDPGVAPFEHVVRIARECGKLLHGVGLRPLLKTSGATGLHVYVPLAPGYTYDHSRMFCEGVARIVCRALPDIATVERNPDRRHDKVYVDFLQNRRGQTVVPPWVPRPVPGATVSTPLHWDELDGDLHPSLFTIRTAAERLETHGDLFRPALTDGQDLLPAIEALGQHMRDG